MGKIDFEMQSIDQLHEFKKWGDTFSRIAHNETTDIFVFERRNPDGDPVCWEIVKPRLRNGVRCYPSTDDFGIYGKCLPPTENFRPRMEELLQNGW
jgi:hypothetical protein